MPPEQSYASHRRFHPLFHFFAFPVLAINLLLVLYNFIRHPIWQIGWSVLVAAALVATVLLARSYSLRQQDRIIRLEERLRLQLLLPDDLRSRINEIRTSQLIALRFCSDEELPEAARAVLAGEVKAPDEIKRRVTQWRADHHRI
jgi:Family of unknown function (DUF6526)